MLMAGGFGLSGRRDYMEDEHVIIEDVQAFYEKESATPLIISSLYDNVEEAEMMMFNEVGINSTPSSVTNDVVKSRYVGVFDGHGGNKASKYCATHLHKLFFQQNPKSPPTEKDDIARMLSNAFEETNNNFLKSVGRIIDDGSTAVVAYILQFEKEKEEGKGIVYVANAGDSRAVIAKRRPSSNDCEAIDLSIDHKASSPSEISRIKSLGGIISQPNYLGKAIGPLRVYDSKRRGGLSVTRGIGDGLLNHLVVATPEITLTYFSSLHPFIILASDGIWDVMSSQQAVDFVFDRLLAGSQVNKLAEDLVQEAFNLGSQDNISAVIVIL